MPISQEFRRLTHDINIYSLHRSLDVCPSIAEAAFVRINLLIQNKLQTELDKPNFSDTPLPPANAIDPSQRISSTLRRRSSSKSSLTVWIFVVCGESSRTPTVTLIFHHFASFQKKFYVTYRWILEKVLALTRAR